MSMQVGIYLGADAAAAALVRPRRRGDPVILAEASCAVPDQFWQADAAEIRKVFQSLARDLGGAARRADVPVCVAMPETRVRDEWISFTQVPPEGAELRRLLEFRIARDNRLDGGSFALDWQGSGAENEVVARIADRALVAALVSACTGSGFQLARLDGLGGYLAPPAASGSALVASVFQTDCEVIGLFGHDTWPTARLSADRVVPGAGPEMAQTLGRTAQAHRIVSGSDRVWLHVAADPDMAVLFARNVGTEETSGPRLGNAALARLVAGNGGARSTSFARPGRPRPRLAAFVAGLVGVAATLAGFLAYDAARELAAGTEKLAGHIEQAAAATASVSGARGFAEIAALADRVDFYNDLVGPRSADLGALLSVLEGAIADQTWLRRLTYDVTTGAVSFQIVSENEADLAPALARLEATGILSSVILDRQLQVRSGQNILAQYDISATVVR